MEVSLEPIANVVRRSIDVVGAVASVTEPIVEAITTLYNTKSNFDRLMDEKELEQHSRTSSVSGVKKVLVEYNISPSYVRLMLIHHIKEEKKVIEGRNNILNTIGDFLKTFLLTLPFAIPLIENNTLSVWINVVSALGFILGIIKLITSFVVYYYTSDQDWKENLISILEFLEK